MCMRRIAGVLLGLGLLAPRVGAADESAPEPLKPTALLRVAAVDDLLAHARYLIGLAGREEEGKQLDALIKKMSAGGKGLQGIDTKKPLGAYARLGPKVVDSQVVVLLPIADEKTFLTFLENLGLKPEKDKGGLYTLALEQVRYPVLFRFANDYVYATLKTDDESASALDKGKLVRPGSALAGAASGVVSLRANLDRVPAQLKKMALSGIDTSLERLKERDQPGETPAQKDFRLALLDEMARKARALINDGQSVVVRLDLDRKAHELSATLDLSARPGSELARDIAALGGRKSVTAGMIGPDSAAGGFVHTALPSALRKALGPVLDDGIKSALEKEKAKAKRGVLGVLEAALPTLKAGVLDLALDFRGPGKGGKYTMVIGVGVKDGDGLDKALRKAYEALPEKERRGVKLDADRAGGAAIHRVTPDKVDAQAKAVFGEKFALYLGVRKDVVIFTAGEDALGAIKGALGESPRAAAPARAEVSLARIAPLMARQEKAAPEAAKKAFKGKGDDKVSLAVDATAKGLRVRVSMKTAVVTFGSLIDKARKGEEEEP